MPRGLSFFGCADVPANPVPRTAAAAVATAVTTAVTSSAIALPACTPFYSKATGRPHSSMAAIRATNVSTQPYASTASIGPATWLARSVLEFVSIFVHWGL